MYAIPYITRYFVEHGFEDYIQKIAQLMCWAGLSRYDGSECYVIWVSNIYGTRHGTKPSLTTLLIYKPSVDWLNKEITCDSSL